MILDFLVLTGLIFAVTSVMYAIMMRRRSVPPKARRFLWVTFLGFGAVFFTIIIVFGAFTKARSQSRFLLGIYIALFFVAALLWLANLWVGRKYKMLSLRGLLWKDWLLFVAMLACLLVFMQVYFWVRVTKSESYRVAMDRLSSDRQIADTIGPIQKSRVESYSGSWNGGREVRRYTIALKGAKGTVRIDVSLEKTTGTWRVKECEPTL